MAEYKVYRPEGTFSGIKVLTDHMADRLWDRGYTLERIESPITKALAK